MCCWCNIPSFSIAVMNTNFRARPDNIDILLVAEFLQRESRNTGAGSDNLNREYWSHSVPGSCIAGRYSVRAVHIPKENS